MRLFYKVCCSVALVLLAVAVSPAFSPALSSGRRPLEIWGHVTDNQHRSLAGVLVSVPALNESTLSDDEGVYRLLIRSKVRPGQGVVIQASRQGFDRMSRPLTLTPKGRVQVNFKLVPLE